MPVIVVAAQKGGSGKSTIVSALAGALITLKKRRVRIIDADEQATTAAWWKHAHERPELRELELVEHIEPDLHQRGPLAEAGQVVIIDCPGRLDASLRSALCVADFLLVPVQPTYPDTWALPKLFEQVRLAQAHRNRPLRAGVVLNRVKTGTKLAQDAGSLAKALPPGFRLLDTRLREAVDFQTSLGEACTPLELHPRGNAAADVRALVDELEKEWKN